MKLLIILNWTWTGTQKAILIMQLTAYLDPLAEHVHALIEALPDAVYFKFKDGAGRWRVANTTGLRLMDLHGHAWVGKTDLELAKALPHRADTFLACHRDDERAWELGKRSDFLQQIPVPDGFRVFSVAKIPLFNSDGSRSGLVAIGHDVTDSIKSEAALEYASEMPVSVFDGMEAIVYAVDIHTHEIVYINQHAERSLNKQIEVGDVCWKGLKYGQDGPCSFCGKHKLADEKGKSTGVLPWDFHVWEYQNTANQRWYHVQGHAIRWIDGRQICLEIATDITDQKKQEAISHQHQADIGHAARLSVAGEMASGLAHELSQPLAAANNYLQGCMTLIESGQHDMKRLSEAIKFAHIQTRRAGKIISHLRNFMHKGRHDRQWVDVNPLVLESIHFLDYEIRLHQVHVTSDFSDLPQIHANPIELEQVLINLLKNAIESMQSAPVRELVIRTRMRDFVLEVEISDTGKGLPESEVDQVFNPFISSKTDGLGLGLTICHSIIESYGGKIWASSALDSGSIFSFTLPVENHA